VVLIMTSNLQGDPKEFFRPEFINRLDDIVSFRSLEAADLAPIVALQVDLLRSRLLDRRIGLELSPEATELLATRGYDPLFGARPLKRLIQREVGDRLATAILEGELTDGDTAIINAQDGEFFLEEVPATSDR
jgi:ATP-dependent Clp protease ATP-binding subunit ClpB